MINNLLSFIENNFYLNIKFNLVLLSLIILISIIIKQELKRYKKELIIT